MAWLVHNEWMTECHEGVRRKREKTYQNLNILYLLKKMQMKGKEKNPVLIKTPKITQTNNLVGNHLRSLKTTQSDF